MCGKDPLLRLMTDKLRTPLRAAVWAILTNGIVYFGAGLWVNHAYKGAQFTGIFDPGELYWGIFVWFVSTPSWWAYFVWQPIAISRTIDSLQKNAVIFNAGEVQKLESTALEPATENGDLSSCLLSALSGPYWPIMALIATSVVVFLYEIFLVPRAPLTLQGKPTFWFVDPRTHSLLLLLIGLNVYSLISFALRTLITIIEFRAFFGNRNSITAIHPLHPDGCGGFSALGVFATQLSFLVVIMGFWAVGFTLFSMLGGAPPQWNLVIAMMYAAYIIAVPIGLITPVWSAHKAMQRFRDSKLSTISHELEKLVTSSMGRLGTMRRAPSIKTLQANVDKMEYFRQMYQFVLDTTPVWPISFPTLKKFGVTAALPVVPGILSFIIDIVQQIRAS